MWTNISLNTANLEQYEICVNNYVIHKDLNVLGTSRKATCFPYLNNTSP